MKTGTVDFICMAPEHRPRSSPSGAGLTVNAGKWAYCPAGATDGHIWRELDGASFSELTRAATTAARADPAQS